MSDAERGDGLTTSVVLHRQLARSVWKADPLVRLFHYPEQDTLVAELIDAPAVTEELLHGDALLETFDGRDAPLTGAVGARRSTTYALVVGVPEGVRVTITPVGLWDPEVKLDGEVVSAAGPARAEVVDVDTGPRHTLVVGAGELGGQYRITVTRR